MPYLDVSLVEGRLTPETEKALIAKLTDAVADVFGPEIRDHTWVVLTEVPRPRWGIGGQPMG